MYRLVCVHFQGAFLTDCLGVIWLLQHKWENAFTIDAATWGYARDDNISSYLNITTVLYEVVSTVAYGELTSTLITGQSVSVICDSQAACH